MIVIARVRTVEYVATAITRYVGYRKDIAKYADHKIATDIPEDTDKYCGAEHGLEQSDRHTNRGICRNARIFGNSIFWVMIFPDGELELAEEVIL